MINGMVRVLILIPFLMLMAPSTGAAQEFNLRILRTSINSTSTTGELYINGEFAFHTLELPWMGNQSYISSIPEGTYTAHVRYDKNDRWRLQLENVPGRTGIQIHIGNYPTEIEGCVLVGQTVDNRNGSVSRSTAAYSQLRNRFYGSSSPNSTPDLTIQVTIDHNTGRTRLINDQGGTPWTYDGNGRWIHGADNAVSYEYRRDQGYIYIKYRGPNTYFRYPLFSGYSAMSSSENGPWSTGQVYFRREN